jgi:hypothetical protein
MVMVANRLSRSPVALRHDECEAKGVVLLPVPTPAPPWTGSLLWLIALPVAFTVSWLLVNRLHLGRSYYVAALLVVTAALPAGYVGWLGLGAGSGEARSSSLHSHAASWIARARLRRLCRCAHRCHSR